MPDPAVLLRSAALDGTVTDVLVDAGTVAAISPDLPAPAGAEVVDLDGRMLVPGLWDAHVHVHQWALARRRLDVAARSAADAVGAVAARLRRPARGGTVLVGHGFRDALWPDAPHRDLLDPVAGDVPVVFVSGDLHCGWLSRGAGRYGAAGHPSGLIREPDWMPIVLDVRSACWTVVRRRRPGRRGAGGRRDRRLRGAVAARDWTAGSPGGRTRCGSSRPCGRNRSTAPTRRRPRPAHRRRRRGNRCSRQGR